MPKLDIVVSHKLSREEATARIEGLLGRLKEEYRDTIKNLNENWENNSCLFSFSVMGSAVSGTLDILSDEVYMTGDLPFAASLFKGKIETMIREKATELLA